MGVCACVCVLVLICRYMTHDDWTPELLYFWNFLQFVRMFWMILTSINIIALWTWELISTSTPVTVSLTSIPSWSRPRCWSTEGQTETRTRKYFKTHIDVRNPVANSFTMDTAWKSSTGRFMRKQKAKGFVGRSNPASIPFYTGVRRWRSFLITDPMSNQLRNV